MSNSCISAFGTLAIVLASTI